MRPSISTRVAFLPVSAGASAQRKPFRFSLELSHTAMRGLLYGLLFEAAGAILILTAWKLN